jgi:hypothetical protein
MGVRMLAIYSLPLGLLAAGLLIGWIGFRATASLYAVVGLIFTVLIAVKWRASLWQSRTLVPVSEVRDTSPHTLSRTSETKGH